MPDETISDSDAWIPAIKNLCLDFLKFLQKRPGGQYLKFRDDIGTAEKPGRIIKEYHNSHKIFKKMIFGRQADKSLLNHHKIAALYIRAFLVCQPFYLEIPEGIKPEQCLLTILPNEFFILPFLDAVFRAWRMEFDGALRLDPVYREDFIKLLYSYKKDINKLDVMSFSYTISIIEKHYFIPSHTGLEG
jgi:hypothetical protein